MKKIAIEICDILSDYHNYDGFQFTPERVVEWVSQFDKPDQLFVLEEFLHLLKQGIYISELKARELLPKMIEKLATVNKVNPVDFLKNAEFINMQPKGKSQSVLLKLLNEELKKKYGMTLADCGTKSKKSAVYIDDILGTGGTIFEDLKEWLQQSNADGETNFIKVTKRSKSLTVPVFCYHNWHKIDWRLKFAFGGNDAIVGKITYRYYYLTDNHPANPDARLNVVYPTKDQPQTVLDYMESVEKRSQYPLSNGEFLFRPANKPANETFFSSAANRIRFENILLKKGIELLSQAKTLKKNHRPMGCSHPTYKTLGTGTLFFTWRNISNTTPIVFWWESATWKPLFPLINRGL